MGRRVLAPAQSQGETYLKLYSAAVADGLLGWVVQLA